MKIKTSELTGVALNWAVAKCEGISTAEFITLHSLPTSEADWKYQHSTNWAQGASIIERESIRIIEPSTKGAKWVARIMRGSSFNESNWLECIGPTEFIAAMRCYVVSKLGDFVNVPEELI